jgi:RNA polymerase sigma-70 factor (ECF subfamily)
MEGNELLEKLRKKDPNAIRLLVDQHQSMVLRTARGFVRNTEDARDITQDVFIDVITNLHRFRGQSALSTWIYRITVNRSLNFLRKNKWKENLSTGDPNDEKGNGPVLHSADLSQKNPAELLELDDRSRILHQALGTLPEKQRIALTLAEFDELSYKEIAEVMQLTVSSVESLIFRAKRNLQKRLWKCYKG